VFAAYRKGSILIGSGCSTVHNEDLAFKAVGVDPRHILLRGIVHDRRQRAVVLAGQNKRSDRLERLGGKLAYKGNQAAELWRASR